MLGQGEVPRADPGESLAMTPPPPPLTSPKHVFKILRFSRKKNSIKKKHMIFFQTLEMLESSKYTAIYRFSSV